jgi:hypothetical protein
MDRSVVPWLLLTVAIIPRTLDAQAPASMCADSLTSSMAFLRGDWEGRSYSVSGRDTTLDALMKVRSRPLFGGCALEEQWEAVKDGRSLFTAKVIRAYDASAQRWSVYYVDDQLNAQDLRRTAGRHRLALPSLPHGSRRADSGSPDLAPERGRLRTVDRALTGRRRHVGARRLRHVPLRAVVRQPVVSPRGTRSA